MTMSALCAFPPLIPAGGIYHHGASLADVSRSGSYASTGTLPVLESSNRNGYAGRTIPYASQVYPYQNCATASSSSSATSNKSVKTGQTDGVNVNLWSTASQRNEPPAPKRRCTDKMQRNCGWSDAIWSSANDTGTIASQLSVICSSGCTNMWQHQQLQHYPPASMTSMTASMTSMMHPSFDVSLGRRPLQERHQNRVFSQEETAVAVATSTTPVKNSPAKLDTAAASEFAVPASPFINVRRHQPRQLSVDPKKDYSAPLSVDCSVEYDLPRIVRPPPGAQPLLILAPPRRTAATTGASVSSLGSSSTACYQPMVSHHGGVWTAPTLPAMAHWPKEEGKLPVKNQSSISHHIQQKIAAAAAAAAAAVPVPVVPTLGNFSTLDKLGQTITINDKSTSLKSKLEHSLVIKAIGLHPTVLIVISDDRNNLSLVQWLFFFIHIKKNEVAKKETSWVIGRWDVICKYPFHAR